MELERWSGLMRALDFSGHEAEFNSLQASYAESHRFYHTGRHIDALLTHFDGVKNQAEAPLDVELAIWYHDCIYQPFSSTNERDSAASAVKFLKENGAQAQQCGNVQRLIMATLHSALPEDHDQKLLVDIDLSILGTTAEVYAQFELDVRKEYRWVPMLMYKRKRRAILNSFLARAAIYQTSYFHDKFEAKARANLAAAIEDLSH